MDRVEFLNSITHRDESEIRSMIEQFWDQHMILYGMVDKIEKCERFATTQNGVGFSLTYTNPVDVNKVVEAAYDHAITKAYGSIYSVSLSQPTSKNSVNIMIELQQKVQG